MFGKVFISLIFAFLVVVRPASAQDAVWIQIEAHPSLRVAQERAQLFSARLPDVSGFSLGGNWYGILLGPYSRTDADDLLASYRATGQIPNDSFISFSSTLGQQFWPVGADIRSTGVLQAPQVAASGVQDETQPHIRTTPEPADETRAEARQGERLLTAEERKNLQIALRAAGFYNSAIDGAFGPGTRRSMSDWQSFNGFEVTGILTTKQRKVLMDQYNAPLISVGMKRVTDRQAGIELQLPAGELKFARYDPPFAHYEASGDLGVRVLLISQPGDRKTLFGLYDIMQTLEIVPLNGPRQKDRDSFFIEGRGNGIVSHTEAKLEDGEIKGFTLVWPEGDEDRRTRVLSEMQNSFVRLDGVLDPGAGAGAAQSVDLMSGLRIRKPKLSRSGFFINDKGTVVTTASAVDGCTRITLDKDYTARVLAKDEALGIAILAPEQPLAPMAVGRLRDGEPRLQSDVAVSGYSYEGVLGAPSLTFGKLADLRGLDGKAEQARLALNALPGDAGGPVIDTGGAIVGMLLPRDDSTRVLPRDVSLAADAAAISAVLERAGLAAETDAGAGELTADELTRSATGMTVLVSCWD